MNKQQLKKNLDQLGIRETSYSLEGDLIPGRMIIFNSYNEWQVFLFDERGNRDQERVFSSESDACYYLFKRLKSAKEIEDKYLK